MSDIEQLTTEPWLDERPNIDEPTCWQHESLPGSDTETVDAVERFRSALWAFEIPRDKNAWNDNPRRAKFGFDDGSLEVNIRDAGMEAAVRKVCAELGLQAVKAFWSMIGKNRATTELFANGLAVHVRTSYDGGWTQFALTDSTVPADTFPEASGYKMEQTPGIYGVGHVSVFGEWLDLHLDPVLGEALEENEISTDRFASITIGVAERMLLQARTAQAGGAIAVGRFTAERLTPLD